MLRDGLFDRFPVDAVFGCTYAGWTAARCTSRKATSWRRWTTGSGADRQGGYTARCRVRIDPVVAGSSLVRAPDGGVPQRLAARPRGRTVGAFGRRRGQRPRAVGDPALSIRTDGRRARARARAGPALVRAQAEATTHVRDPRGRARRVLVNDRRGGGGREIARAAFGEAARLSGRVPRIGGLRVHAAGAEGHVLLSGNGDTRWCTTRSSSSTWRSCRRAPRTGWRSRRATCAERPSYRARARRALSCRRPRRPIVGASPCCERADARRGDRPQWRAGHDAAYDPPRDGLDRTRHRRVSPAPSPDRPRHRDGRDGGGGRDDRGHLAARGAAASPASSRGDARAPRGQLDTARRAYDARRATWTRSSVSAAARVPRAVLRRDRHLLGGHREHRTEARLYRHRAIACPPCAASTTRSRLRARRGARARAADEVEPDGAPNRLNIPTSTTQGNTLSPHLALGHYSTATSSGARRVAGCARPGAQRRHARRGDRLAVHDAAATRTARRGTRAARIDRRGDERHRERRLSPAPAVLQGRAAGRQPADTRHDRRAAVRHAGIRRGEGLAEGEAAGIRYFYRVSPALLSAFGFIAADADVARAGRR